MQSLVGRRQQQRQQVPDLIANPRDVFTRPCNLIASPRDVIVSPRGAVVHGGYMPPAHSDRVSTASCGTAVGGCTPRFSPRSSPRHASFVRRVCAIVPRLHSSSDCKVARVEQEEPLSDVAAGDREPSRAAATCADDSVTLSCIGRGGDSMTQLQHSSPISAHASPRWRVAAAHVRSRGQGAIAAGREKVALGREKGRMLLASVSNGAGSAVSLFKRMKAAVGTGGAAREKLEGDLEEGGDNTRQGGSRSRLRGLWCRMEAAAS